MANDWQTVPLAQVLRQDTNYVTELEPIIYPKLSVKLYGKGVTLDAPADGANVKMQRHQFSKPGQVILSEIWAKKGAIGIVPPDGAGALVTSHFFLFDIDETKVLPAFIGWLLKGNFFAELLDAQAHGTTGYAAVRPKQFLALEIPLPPLTEQRGIVACIEALAARVAEAQSLRREASEEADKLSGSATCKLFTELADTYKPIPIGNTFTYRNDLIRPTDEKTGEIRFIGLQHVESNTGRRIGEDKLYGETLTGRKFIFSPGDIVYGYLRPYLNKVWIADCDGVCSVDQYVIQPKNKIIDAQYLAYFMRSPAFLDKAIDLTHNLLLPRLRTGLLNSISIPVPSLEEQRRLVAYLDGLQARVSALRVAQAETERELSALMPSVLDRAFKGEL
jgi:type I restriction enzyme, S subunit